MSEKKELTCIGCPMGCQMEVIMENGVIQSIVGATCKKGELYAAKEVVDPRRVITSIVPVDGGIYAMAPVKTATDIPKGAIRQCMECLKTIRVEAPVSIGQVIVADLCGTGVALIATRDIPKR